MNSWPYKSRVDHIKSRVEHDESQTDHRKIANVWAPAEADVACFCLRNRKHVPCFYRVIETFVKVWENEKC